MKNNKIYCKWVHMRKIMIDYNGQVLPCSYFADVLLHNTDTVNLINSEYTKNIKDLNINTRSLEAIISGKWFTETLPNSWSDPESAMECCRTHCSNPSISNKGDVSISSSRYPYRIGDIYFWGNSALCAITEYHNSIGGDYGESF